MMNQCDICGREFDTSHWRTKPDDEPRVRTTPGQPRSRSDRKRCSAECDDKAERQRHSEWRRRKRQNGGP